MDDGARVAQIPSEHCRRLIQMLLLNTMAKGAEDDGDEDEADPSDMETEIPALKLTVEDARRLLYQDFDGDTTSTSEDGLHDKRKKTARESDCACKVGAATSTRCRHASRR